MKVKIKTNSLSLLFSQTVAFIPSKNWLNTIKQISGTIIEINPSKLKPKEYFLSDGTIIPEHIIESVVSEEYKTCNDCGKPISIFDDVCMSCFGTTFSEILI